jgi:hypothetical protein
MAWQLDQASLFWKKVYNPIFFSYPKYNHRINYFKGLKFLYLNQLFLFLNSLVIRNFTPQVNKWNVFKL